MPMFNVFRCKSCLDRWGQPKLAEAPYSAAMAYPRCEICNKTMTYVGTSDVPLAPGLPSPLKLLQLDMKYPDKSANPDKVLINENGQDTTGRNVSVTVTKKYGQQCIVIDLNVDGKAIMVRLASSLLKKNGNTYADYLVSSPFPVQGQNNCWVRMDGRQLNERNRVVDGAKLPAPFFDIAMPLGGIRYGLIHLLAGHHQNTRTWLAKNNNAAHLTPPEPRGASAQAQQEYADAMTKYKADIAEQESYRSFLGILEGLTQSFEWKNLQGIIKAGMDKYVIVGTDQATPVKLVVKKSGLNYTVTTLFRAPEYSMQNPNLKGGESRVWLPPTA